MSVPSEQIMKALAALKRYFAAANGSKKAVRQLLQNRVPILVRFQLKRLQKRSGLFAKKIATPHPVYHDGVEACLFVSDQQRGEKEEILNAHPFVKKLIPLTNLKLHYHEYEKLRRLYHSYDVFYADRSVVGMMPQFLGKKFISSKKSPLPVTMKQLDAAHRGTTLVCSASDVWEVRIGDIQMPSEELAANAAAVIGTVTELLERKNADVQLVSVRLDQDGVPHLPVYNSVPLNSELDEPEVFEAEAKEAECELHSEKTAELEVERELNAAASDVAEAKKEDGTPATEGKPAEMEVEEQPTAPKNATATIEEKPAEPETKVATPKKTTPKKATPKKATPKKEEEVKPIETEEKPAEPEKETATPKKTTPKKATPKKATPKKEEAKPIETEEKVVETEEKAAEPGKETATPKKTTPRKVTPKKATPKKEEVKPIETEEKVVESETKVATPKKATPKKETPKKGTPKKEEAKPAETETKTETPKKATPKKTTPKKPASASKRPRADGSQPSSTKKAKTPAKAAQ